MTTNPRTRGMIFAGWQARAIDDGRLTMTRRVMKFPPEYPILRDEAPVLGAVPGEWHYKFKEGSYGWNTVCCPFGVPGDRLYVKETFKVYGWDCYSRDGSEYYEWLTRYKSDDTRRSAADPLAAEQLRRSLSWRSSRHMPRWASRFLLEITSVGVERVQEISYDGAIAEGCDMDFREEVEPYPGSPSCDGRHYGAQWHFKRSWDSLNAKRGHGWDVNDWVWVLGLKLVKGEVLCSR